MIVIVSPSVAGNSTPLKVRVVAAPQTVVSSATTTVAVTVVLNQVHNDDDDEAVALAAPASMRVPFTTATAGAVDDASSAVTTGEAVTRVEAISVMLSVLLLSVVWAEAAATKPKRTALDCISTFSG